MYQKTTILGHLGNDPEMRYLQSGLAVTSFRVAVNNNRKSQDNPVSRVSDARRGENRATQDNGSTKETTWFRVSIFGKQAELCNQYLTKGRLVLVEGTLKGDPITGSPRIFERKDGSVGASFDLTASQVKFLSTNGSSEASHLMSEHAELIGDEGEEIPF